MITVKWQQRRSDLLNINLSGKLQEHFGFKLLADHNIDNANQVYYVLSDKSFAYHGSNRWQTYHLKKTPATIFKTLACKISFIWSVHKCTAEILI